MLVQSSLDQRVNEGIKQADVIREYIHGPPHCPQSEAVSPKS